MNYSAKGILLGATTIFLSMSLIGCLSGQVEETIIYLNDFEDDLNGVSNTMSTAKYSDSRTESYNGSTVLGRYGFDGITINLEDIPSFDFIEVSFEINIHDKWEGNGGVFNNNTPDIFIFNIDDFNIVYSTFVNTTCQSQDCNSAQSYPQSFGATNPENSDAYVTNLPGVCEFKDVLGGSKKYKYLKRFNQSGSSIKFSLGAQLSGVTTTNFCLKSWSIDNLKVVGITIPEIL